MVICAKHKETTQKRITNWFTAKCRISNSFFQRICLSVSMPLARRREGILQ